MSSDFPHKRYEELAYKKLTGQITAAESDELSRWLNEDNGLPLEIDSSFARSRLEHRTRMLATIKEQIGVKTTSVHFMRTKWMRYAAAIFLFLATATYLFFKSGQPRKEISNNTLLKTEVLPGGNKAILTLANGSTIDLNNANAGRLANENGSDIVKSENGWIEYNASTAKNYHPTSSYNTIQTPKGGQYQVKLPDGTLAWLNAASSIRFPTVFSGYDRKVNITGEVYFEVAKDSKKPFKVMTASQEIIVLGTDFNINSYPDEEHQTTTLLQGSVQVRSINNNKSVMLKPFEQSTLSSGGQLKLVKNADIEEATAWKNGLFSFHNAEIRQVMQQLARWYDVEVRYEGAIPQRRFGGKISRSYKLSEVLEVLQASDVHFRIVNNTIIITNSR